ncbi:MAG: polysaccharide biosynthesis/export family protein [Alphaproteobacteria bacterium]|nr:polysaccharide biosynthesis/export family protein [Alphaproteobacteria bacterium]
MTKTNKKYPGFKPAATALALLLSLAACATQPADYAPLSTLKAEPALPPAAPAVYRIGPGDVLDIKFFFAPEMNESVTVRPDGKISIMFAQDIQAAGLTADELAANIRAVLAPHLKQLDLVVIVRSFASQRAYVGGEVTKPGPVILTGGETLMQILADAGWMTPAAGADNVVLVRRDDTGHEKTYRIDVAQMERGFDMAQNVPVESGDLILVPPSGIVESDRWVDQNIRQLLPFSPSAGVAYNINTTPTQ